MKSGLGLPLFLVISEEKYKIINSQRDPESMDFAKSNRAKLEDYRPYQKIRQVILDLENRAAQNFGLHARSQIYVDWFDNDRYNKASELPSNVHQSEYIVLLEDLYPQKVSNLMLPDSGYRLAAKCQFVNPLGLRPEFPFVNPPVYIFHRIASN